MNPTFSEKLYSNCMAGGFAGSTSMAVVYPLDFTRTRLAADTAGQFKGMRDCLTQIIKSDGPLGLYRGFRTSVVTIFFYRASYFGLYDTSKGFLGEKPSIYIKFIVANIVTNTSALIAYPFDTIRRRLMLQSGESQKMYSGAIDCLTKVVATEGFNGLYKGFLSNIFRGVGASMVLVLYDEL